jgi:sugar/nucleoside kinase (ribokinase family)
MSIIAVGSLAFDSIRTSVEERDKILGGSLTHFVNAAGFLSKPKLVGVVGNDFGDKEWEFIKSRTSSLEGVEVLKDKKSFFWKGHYGEDTDIAITDATELNAFSHFKPVVPLSYKDGEYMLFMANIDPVIQTDMAKQCDNAMLKVMDTMNYWIKNTPEELDVAFDNVDGIVINDNEATMLTGEKNILKAVEKVFRPHFKIVIIKKGSHGVMIFGTNFVVSLPSYPVKNVIDPTGAGDSFAGAFFSFIAANGAYDFHRDEVKNAAVYATVVASFAVEGFGVEGISEISPSDIENRIEAFKGISGF